VCLAVVFLGAGAVYFFHWADAAKPAAVAEAPARPAARAAAGKRPSNPDDAAAPSAVQIDESARLIGDARRLAADGRFTEAKAALDKADKIIPGRAETAQVRRDIEQMSTPTAQLAIHLERARSAIDRSDWVAAEAAIAEAQQLSPQAPEIAQVRDALQEAEQKEARRSGHIADLLSAMRAAIARHDLAAADRALNEAARLDVRDPALDEARTELARAQANGRKGEMSR
jgi:hypothetical protein